MKYIVYPLLIFVTCMGGVTALVYAEKQRKNRLMETADTFVTENNGKADVLFIAPKDGSMTNTKFLAIIEGPTNKKRMQLIVDTLPIPGETWGVRNDDGELKLTEKVEK